MKLLRKQQQELVLGKDTEGNTLVGRLYSA